MIPSRVGLQLLARPPDYLGPCSVDWRCNALCLSAMASLNFSIWRVNNVTVCRFKMNRGLSDARYSFCCLTTTFCGVHVSIRSARGVGQLLTAVTSCLIVSSAIQHAYSGRRGSISEMCPTSTLNSSRYSDSSSGGTSTCGICDKPTAHVSPIVYDPERLQDLRARTAVRIQFT